MTGGAKSGEPGPPLADGDAAARQRLLAILDTCPIAVGVSNLDDGTIVYANNLLRDISRVDNGRNEGKSATDYWADAADRAAFVDAFQQSGHVSREVRMKRHDGSPYWALVQWESDPLFPGQVIFWVRDISALKRAQDNLRDANAEITRHRDHLSDLVAERTRELRTIADNLPVLIVRIDVHERFTFANATAAIWYDRPAGSIIGRSLQDTVGDAAYRLLQPRIARALSGRHASFEETILFPDGVERVVDVTLVPEIGSEKRVIGVFSLIVDISQRKRVELALRDSEKRFRDYTDASSDWHWETDERHVFTYVSANFETLTGIPLSEALGKTRQELSVESRDTAEWREHEAAMMRHQPFRDFRSVRQSADGRVLWVSVSGIPRFDAVGRFIGYRGTGREITALVEAEQALHESAERLNQAQKMQAVGQLTGGVAHDFNNLLAVILGNAELLVLGEGDAAELAEPILRAAERGGELTQRLLAFFPAASRCCPRSSTWNVWFRGSATCWPAPSAKPSRWTFAWRPICGRCWPIPVRSRARC